MVALLFAGLWFAFHLYRKHGTGGTSRHGRTGQAQSSNVNSGLRSLVLNGARENFGLGPGKNSTQPFAVVTDAGMANGSTTIIAIADGSASVYQSDGARFIGGGQTHDSIRKAALEAVAAADDVQALMHRATEYPLPPAGQVNFYAVTDEGVFTAKASVEDVRSHRTPLAKLGDATQAIVTEYERVQPRQ